MWSARLHPDHKISNKFRPVFIKVSHNDTVETAY